MSYHRGYPAFVLNVDRDEDIMGKISEALAKFYVSFDAAMRQMKEIAA